jgi:hypothetical protein
MMCHSLAFRRPANLAIFAVPRQPGVMSQLISGMPHRERLVATTKSPTRGQLQATAGSHAVNSGDRHGYQVVDHRDGLLIHPDLPNEIRWLPVVELLHVIPGAQNVSPAPRRITMRQAPLDGDLLDRGVELGRHLTIERVVTLRTVQRDRRDRPPAHFQYCKLLESLLNIHKV